VGKLLKLPALVGYHQFAFVDQPSTGTSSGENSNWGLVHMSNDVYSVLATTFKQLNGNAVAAHNNESRTG
jgi:hypothetical protein